MVGRSGQDPVLQAGLEVVGLCADDFEPVSRSRGRCGYRAPALGLFARTDVAGRETLATHEARFARGRSRSPCPQLAPTRASPTNQSSHRSGR